MTSLLSDVVTFRLLHDKFRGLPFRSGSHVRFASKEPPGGKYRDGDGNRHDHEVRKGQGHLYLVRGQREVGCLQYCREGDERQQYQANDGNDVHAVALDLGKLAVSLVDEIEGLSC
jgi:hypothetical protein